MNGLDDAMAGYIEEAKKASEGAENQWERDRPFINSVREQVEAKIPDNYKK